MSKEEAIALSKIYSEEDMIKAARYGYEYHQDSQFQNLKFDEMAINNFKQLLESNKLGEESESKMFHVGDIMTTDLKLEYPQYYVKVEDYRALEVELKVLRAATSNLKRER